MLWREPKVYSLMMMNFSPSGNISIFHKFHSVPSRRASLIKDLSDSPLADPDVFGLSVYGGHAHIALLG
jgi:hypothetical protein